MWLHITGGILIVGAMVMYILVILKATKKIKHNRVTLLAVLLDISGSIVMSSGSEGFYLFENFDKLNGGQIFHLIISPIALLLMIFMLISGYLGLKIHKKIGRFATFIWFLSFLSGFLMIKGVTVNKELVVLIGLFLFMGTVGYLVKMKKQEVWYAMRDNTLWRYDL